MERWPGFQKLRTGLSAPHSPNWSDSDVELNDSEGPPLRTPPFDSVAAGKYFQYQGFKASFVSLGPLLPILDVAC